MLTFFFSVMFLAVFSQRRKASREKEKEKQGRRPDKEKQIQVRHTSRLHCCCVRQ